MISKKLKILYNPKAQIDFGLISEDRSFFDKATTEIYLKKIKIA